MTQAAAEHLDVRHCLGGGQTVPAPKPFSERCKASCEQNIALVIRQIYATDVGWLMPEDLRRRYRNTSRTYHYPLVFKYLVDAATQDGESRTQEIAPWAYKRLEWHAKQGVCQNTI